MFPPYDQIFGVSDFDLNLDLDEDTSKVKPNSNIHQRLNESNEIFHPTVLEEDMSLTFTITTITLNISTVFTEFETSLNFTRYNKILEMGELPS